MVVKNSIHNEKEIYILFSFLMELFVCFRCFEQNPVEKRLASVISRKVVPEESWVKDETDSGQTREILSCR